MCPRMQCQSISTVFCNDDIIACISEIQIEQVNDAFFIFYNENLLGHLLRSKNS